MINYFCNFKNKIKMKLRDRFLIDLFLFEDLLIDLLKLIKKITFFLIQKTISFFESLKHKLSSLYFI